MELQRRYLAPEKCGPELNISVPTVSISLRLGPEIFDKISSFILFYFCSFVRCRCRLEDPTSKTLSAGHKTLNTPPSHSVSCISYIMKFLATTGLIAKCFIPDIFRKLCADSSYVFAMIGFSAVVSHFVSVEQWLILQYWIWFDRNFHFADYL